MTLAELKQNVATSATSVFDSEFRRDTEKQLFTYHGYNFARHSRGNRIKRIGEVHWRAWMSILYDVGDCMWFIREHGNGSTDMLKVVSMAVEIMAYPNWLPKSPYHFNQAFCCALVYCFLESRT